MRRELTGMVLGSMLLGVGTPAGGGRQLAAQVQQEIQQALGTERDLRAIRVEVSGTEATLTGRVPTLWAKTHAIERTLEIAGVEAVVSELTIPAVEDDNDLAREVSEAVESYPYYTIWDYIDGHISRGLVTLIGSVTPDRDKREDLFERVAKVPGVQDVHNTIEIQSASSLDADLRQSIGTRIFGSVEFQEYSTWPHPPFHIVVDRGSVRLMGLVRSEFEARRLEQIVNYTPRVLRLVNELRIDPT